MRITLIWFFLFSPWILSCHQGARTSGTWAPLPLSPLEALKDSVSVWTGEKILIWGGDGVSGSVNSGASYDLTTDSWTLMSSTSFVPNDRTDLMDFHGIWTGTHMMVWSGRSSDGEYGSSTTQRTIRDDGGIYAPETDTWTAIRETDLSPGRAYVHGVWTGTQMIVWGGNHETSASGAEDLGVEEPTMGAIFNPGNALDDGAFYHPDTNTWTTMAAVETLSGRRSFVQIWTGSQLIVWGGYNGIDYFSDGAIFTP